MTTEATISITPKGATNSNLLRTASWQLSDFYLKASGKRTKCYRPEGAPEAANASDGNNEFNFAPEYETLEIHYVIDDPCGAVKGASLELFCRFESKPLWTLELAKLGDDWLKHGEHRVKWDGRIIKGDKVISGTVQQKKIHHDLTTQTPDTQLDKERFPDGFVTLANTPYKLKLTLTPHDKKRGGVVEASWLFFQLLIKKIDIELGEEELIPAVTVDDKAHKLNKALRLKVDSSGGVPASGSTRKINLISNLYKIASSEMNDNTAFDEFNALWGDGPQIPLIAKVSMLDSAGNAVKLADEAKGSVALGKVKFLWDWEDVNENVAGQQSAAPPYDAKPSAFITAAIDYYKAGTDPTRAASDHTYPKGDNCHVDRGGKRGPGAKAIFPDQAGYAAKSALDLGKFPFKVEACKERKWAAYSYGWRSGKLKGCTGVSFSPSRMAGDDYQISVYLAFDQTAKDKWVLDKKDEPLTAPADIKATTGEWQLWREIHIARYIRKQSASIVAYLPANIGAVKDIYDDAYVDVVDKMTANDSYQISDHRKADGNPVDYNALALAKLNASGNPMFTNDLAITRADNHLAEDAGLKSHTYAEFVQNFHAFAHAAVAASASDLASIAAANGMTVTNLANTLASAPFGPPPHSPRIARLVVTQNWLNTNNLNSIPAYSSWLDGQAFGVLTSMVSDGVNFGAIAGAKSGSAPGAEQGVTVVHFNFSNSYLRDLVAAATPGIGYINGAAIDTTDADRTTCAFIFTNALLDTFCHEIGHHMFLPHARFSRGATPPAGAQANRHDDIDTHCMMSYNRPRRAFCGLCQLRLRGWDANALDKILANNKKT